MKYLTAISITLIFCLCVTGVAHSNGSRCDTTGGITLQVLGSGGPIADDDRASSAYLVWVDSRSRFMIDTGGGAFLRFGEAGAHFEDLAHIGISHFHTDHSSDLAALLKSGYFSNRKNSLSISGPAGGGAYPGMHEYLNRLVGANSGAYAYLAGYLDGSAGLVKLESNEVDPNLIKASQVFADPVADVEVTALGVPHGPVPALAYRIRIGNQHIVFSGDQNGSSDAFINFARGSDVLVMHMPVPEDIGGVGRKLHAPPSIIGKIAAETEAGKLVLSHFMARSLDTMKANLKEIHSRYTGTVVRAHDLDCVEI